MAKASFQNAVAVITGGGSGMGRSLCLRLAAEGATVVVADIDVSRAESVVSEVTTAGGTARAIRVDVSKEQDVWRLIQSVVSEFGRIDYQFNNAGIALFGDARDLTIEQWRRVLDVNLYGALHGTVIVYPIMVKQGFGHIVNVASSAGLTPAPTEAAYCTSKYAVVGMSLSLRVEGADLGVRVSVVCPGYVRTSMFQAATVVNIPAEKRGAMTPHEVADKSREAPIILNPRRAMGSSKAAATILEGVRRNRPVIAFPADVRIGWYLYRISPRLMDRMLMVAARDFRKYRGASQAGLADSG